MKDWWNCSFTQAKEHTYQIFFYKSATYFKKKYFLYKKNNVWFLHIVLQCKLFLKIKKNWLLDFQHNHRYIYTKNLHIYTRMMLKRKSLGIEPRTLYLSNWHLNHYATQGRVYKDNKEYIKYILLTFNATVAVKTIRFLCHWFVYALRIGKCCNTSYQWPKIRPNNIIFIF